MSQVTPRAKATVNDSLSPKQSDTALSLRLQLSEPSFSFIPFHSRRFDFLVRPWTYGACLVPGTAYSLASWADSFPFITFSKSAFTYLFFNEALLDHTISNDKWPVCQPLALLSSCIQLCGIFFHSSSWFITSQIIYLFIYTYMHTLHMQPVSLFICCPIWVCYSTLGQLHKRVTDLRVVFVMFTDKLPTLLRLGHRNCVENVYWINQLWLPELRQTVRIKELTTSKSLGREMRIWVLIILVRLRQLPLFASVEMKTGEILRRF